MNPPSNDAWDMVVPDDFPTIQDAIDHAKLGFKIFIRKGIYMGSVLVDKENILLHGMSKEDTVIDGREVERYAIRITALGVVLENLTVRNAYREIKRQGDWNLSGILIESRNVTIKNCIIRDNRLGINVMTGSYNLTIVNNSFFGDGIFIGNYIGSCKLSLEDFMCRIENNTVSGKPICYLRDGKNMVLSGEKGQIILVNSTNITIRDMIFEKGDFPIILAYCSNCTIRNVTVMDNDIGIEILTGSSYNLVESNLIYSNQEAIAITNFYCKNSIIKGNIIRGNRIEASNIGIVISTNSFLRRKTP